MGKIIDTYEMDTWCHRCKQRTQHQVQVQSEKGENEKSGEIVDVHYITCEICDSCDEYTGEEANNLTKECLSCHNAFCKEGKEFDTLICIFDEKEHKKVEENYVCSNYA